MFPPEYTPNLLVFLNRLKASLARAGPNFTEDPPEVEEVAVGVLVTLKLSSPVPKPARVALSKYLRDYARDSGWQVPGVSYSKVYISFLASRAEARVWKNR